VRATAWDAPVNGARYNKIRVAAGEGTLLACLRDVPVTPTLLRERIPCVPP